jgi:tyrosine-protein kinase
LSERSDDASVLRDWLSVISRQRWIVLLAVTVAAVLAFAASHSQQRLYQASATVLVNEQNPTTSEALNLSTPPASPPDRYAATQAKLARVGAVADLAVKMHGPPLRTATALLANSSVSADPTNDLLTFSVTDPVPKVAVTLANRYGRAFTVYRHRLDTAALSAALRDTQRKLDAIVASGGGTSALFRRVQSTQSDLEDLQTLEGAGSSAQLVGAAGTASLVQPKTRRNVILALIAGLALGIALAFIRETLDRRVRSADELRELLGVPLLGHVPRSGSRVVLRGDLTTLFEPVGPSTEAFRILKNNLEISQLEHHAGSIAITSTSEHDGAPAAAANLAVVLARSGRHVILVDLDLRRPRVAGLFGLDDPVGLTSIAPGVSPVDALWKVNAQPDGSIAHSGTLELLPVGPRPFDPGEFLVSSVVTETLEVLEERADLLLIVTPPLLASGDAMTIAPHADALIIVAGIDRARPEALVETRRVLERCPTFTLGVIATGGKAMKRGNRREALRSVHRSMRNGYGAGQRLLAGPAAGRVADASRRLVGEISAPIRSSIRSVRRGPATEGREARRAGAPELPAKNGRRPEVHERAQQVRDG